MVVDIVFLNPYMVHYTMTSELLSRVSEIVRSDLTIHRRRAKGASPEHISER